MKLKAWLCPNHLTEDKSDFIAVPYLNGSLAATEVVLNEPSRLLILTPATLQAGEYELTVTTQYCSGSATLKQPRSVTADLPVVIS